MSMFHELMMKKKGIPSRYQEVEYIESDGTQYIDTGVKTNSLITIDCKLSTANQYGSVFGSRVAYGNKAFALTNVSGWVRADYNNSALNLSPLNSVRIIKSRYTETEYIFENYDESEILVNSVTFTKSNFTSDINLFLFARNDNGVPILNSSNKTTIYFFKIYDNNRLVRNFIPVYDTETQKYGMWESVQGKFYGNDGTGDFKGSIVGYTIVGSPTITDGVASGFSSANKLYTPETPDTMFNDTFFQIKFKTNTLNTFQYIIFYTTNNNNTASGIGINSSGQLTWVVGRENNAGTTYNLNTNYNVIADTYYWVRGIAKNGVATLQCSLDGISWETIGSIEYANLNITYSFGIGAPKISGAYRVFTGSIDLNETYTKINNKLWFNGQQA